MNTFLQALGIERPVTNEVIEDILDRIIGTNETTKSASPLLRTCKTRSTARGKRAGLENTSVIFITEEYSTLTTIFGPDAFVVSSNTNIDAYPTGTPDYAYNIGSGAHLTVMPRMTECKPMPGRSPRPSRAVSVQASPPGIKRRGGTSGTRAAPTMIAKAALPCAWRRVAISAISIM